MLNRLRIVLICLSGSFVISGILNPIGLLGSPVAEAFGIPVTDAVSRFGGFTVGVFVGYILSFRVFDVLRVKSVVIGGYLLLAATIAALYAFPTATAFVPFLFVIGVITSVQVCGASTLASWTWQDKSRQTVLIAQDAMFNGGGIAFTTLTAWLLARSYHWASAYLVVAGIAILVAAVALVTRIEQPADKSESDSVATTWNVGICAVGVSVLLFMVAKISIFIWAPQYAEQVFGADVSQSGRLLRNIFIGAFAGSLIGTWVVSRVRIEYFLMAMLSVGATGVFLMLGAPDLPAVLLTGYVVGASVGATFNGYMAFALSFVVTPTHRNVAYVLLAGGVGSAIAPLFSSWLVAANDSVASALWACLAIQGTVLVSVILLSVLRRRQSAGERTR